MGRQKPGRFTRQWQRERARQAQAEADESAVKAYWIARVASRFGPFFGPLWRPRVGNHDTIEPYRGFRAGRGRWRPDSTGYDEPVVPAAADDPWHGNPWLNGMESGAPVSDGLIDDEYDNYDDLGYDDLDDTGGVGGEHDGRPPR